MPTPFHCLEVTIPYLYRLRSKNNPLHQVITLNITFYVAISNIFFDILYLLAFVFSDSKLENKFHIPMNRDAIGEELRSICNLSDLVEQKASARTQKSGCCRAKSNPRGAGGGAAKERITPFESKLKNLELHCQRAGDGISAPCSPCGCCTDLNPAE